MVYDPSNPFHQLAKKLSSRRQAEAQTPASGNDHACGSKMPSHHGAAAQRPLAAQDEICAQVGDEAEDFSLFLNSVKAVQLTQDTANAAADEEALLFIKSTQGVTPLASRGREVALPAGKEKSAPRADPARVLRDLLEGSLEFALYHSDEFMQGHVVGIDPLVLARLRAGQFSPEAHLDLHGQNAAQAQASLTCFVKNAYQRGMRTILVVTGRGRNSPDGIGVLRPLLQQWLSREPFKRVVLAFCTAKPGDGGPGALYVLLRKYKKSRGKIIWDRCPSSEEYPDM